MFTLQRINYSRHLCFLIFCIYNNSGNKEHTIQLDYVHRLKGNIEGRSKGGYYAEFSGVSCWTNAMRLLANTQQIQPNQ